MKKGIVKVKNGYEDGYKESYDEYTQKAKDEADFIKIRQT